MADHLIDRFRSASNGLKQAVAANDDVLIASFDRHIQAAWKDLVEHAPESGADARTLARFFVEILAPEEETSRIQSEAAARLIELLNGPLDAFAFMPSSETGS